MSSTPSHAIDPFLPAHRPAALVRTRKIGSNEI